MHTLIDFSELNFVDLNQFPIQHNNSQCTIEIEKPCGFKNENQRQWNDFC